MTASLRRRPAARRGGTLLEVIVALVVFAIGFLSLSAGSLVAGRAMKESRDLALVTALAQHKLDSVASRGWVAIEGASGSGTLRGHAFAWDVTGVDPRIIQIVVTRRTTPQLVTDTLSTRLHR
ncbi:MAG TPA: prepilin-type N-terminal cleavage/methylation domain-containing protein [Gemmatimonadales bacterium]|jgi:prepilin-type N-terminal cleavage/methylation domain-containing protein|nr:prepilin-type N-terminal cleavage/methylation domain-containing protein [Gemmatimonadales bacterium]